MNYFKPFNHNQLYLLPPDIREWLPEDHLAAFVHDAVEFLNLDELIKPYLERDPRGNKAYHPKLMLGVLIYAYAIGIYSSRKIEKYCIEDVPFRFLSANTCPDHSTIAEFRRANLPMINNLFVQVLCLCQKAKLLNFGLVALDGTKIKANAALERNLTPEKLLKTLEILGVEVSELLKKAETTDQVEDERERREGKSEIPENLRKAQSRLATLRAAHAQMVEESRVEAEQAVKEAAEKAEKRAQKELATGKKTRGRKPKSVPTPEEVNLDENMKYNETDPESRIMVDARTKGFIQGFNAQTMVTKEQIIVVAEVTNKANDKEQLEPMVGKLLEVIASVTGEGEPKDKPAVTADAGYFSETQLKGVSGSVLALVSPDRKLGESASETTSKMKDEMRKRLMEEPHHLMYKKRKTMVEPVFGQIKEQRGFRRFSFRSQEKVGLEWKLIGLAHNILKVFRSGIRIGDVILV